VFRTVTTKQGEAASPVPPTRKDLYLPIDPVQGRAAQDVVVG
jgi:hypothetical protein